MRQSENAHFTGEKEDDLTERVYSYISKSENVKDTEALV